MDSDHTVNDNSDATRDQRFNDIRHRFERLHQAGDQPRIEEFVDQVAASHRSELLRHLLCIELRAHAPHDLDPQLEPYLNRFPKEDGLVRSVFEELSRVSGEETVTPVEQVGVDVKPAEKTYVELRTDAPTHIDPRDSSLEMPEAPGRTYAVQREVGAGGMGLILEVWDEKLKRPLAMKVIRRDEDRSSYLTPSHSHLMRRFLREAEITAHLEHPGVVPVHEVGLDEQGKLYFTMRLIKGKSLHEVFRELKRGGSEWTAARVLDVMVNVCQTMAFAHSRGVIHRDLKPANVMVGEFGETYVMDWGLAKSMAAEEAPDESTPRRRGKPSAWQRNPFVSSLGNREDATIDGAVLGTPAYMPPEQARGQVEQVDTRSDVYAVGTMLYQLLTGSAPYTDEIPRRNKDDLLDAVQQRPPTPIARLNSSVSPELIAICEKAMARDKAERYSDLRAMATDLQAFMEHRVVRAYRTGPWIELYKWIRRNRGLAIASFAAVLLAVTGLLAAIRIQCNANRELAAALKDVTAAKNVAVEAQLAETVAREQSDEDRRRVEALYLSRESNGIRDEDPGIALLLAMEAANREANVMTHGTVLSALLELREERTFLGHESEVVACAFHPHGRMVATASADYTAAIWDVRSGERLAWLVGHDGRIEDIRFSPDGGSVATASFDGTVKIWNSQTGALESTLSGHRGQVRTLAYAAQGDILFTCSVDGTARAWDVRSGGDPRVLSGHRGLVTQLAVSPDGSRVATGSADRTVRLWSMDGALIDVLEGHEGGISEVVFSTDGLWLATAAGAPFDYSERDKPMKGVSQDATVRIWNAADGSPAQTLKASAQRIDAVAWKPDSRQLVAAGPDGLMHHWTVDPASAEAEVQRALGPIPADEVTGLTFNAAGTHVLASVGKRAFLMSLATGGVEARFFGHTDQILACCLSPDGTRALTASRDGTARLWRSTSSVLAPIPMKQAGAQVRLHPSVNRMLVYSTKTPELLLCGYPEPAAIATIRLEENCRWADLSPDGKTLVTISKAGQLQIRSASDGQSVRTLASGINALDASFSADGQRLLVWSPKDSSITEWDLRSGEETRLVDTAGMRPDRPCQNWSRLIASSFENEIEVWDVPSGEMLFVLPPSPSVRIARLNANGSRLVLRSHVDRQVQLMNVDTRETVAWLEHDGQINSSPFSADGNHVATVATDGAAKLWDARTGKLLGTFTRPTENILSVRIGPRLEYLATISADNTVALHKVKTGNLLGVIADKQSGVDDVLFSPNGSQILLRSGRSATLWATETALQVGELRAPNEGVLQSAKFSPDNNWVITSTVQANDSGANTSVRIWPVELFGFAQQRRPRLLTPDERDLFQVGSDAERQEERLRYELSSMGKSLADLAFRVQSGEGKQYRVRQAVRDVVDEIGQSLQSLDPDAASAVSQDIREVVDHPEYEDSESLVTLSSIYEQTGNLRDAVLVLERVVSCPNPPPTATEKLAELRQQLWPDLVSYASIDSLFTSESASRPDSAMLRGFKRVAHNELDNRVLYFEARLHQQNEQYQAAIAALDEVLAADPADAGPYLRLAECLIAVGRPSDAEEVLRGALEWPIHGASELWMAWATLNFTNLNMDAAELLSAWPQSPAATTSDAPHGLGDDLKWVCERLARGDFLGINCGGEGFTDSHGQVWSGDRFHLGGWGFLGAQGTPQIFNGDIDGTEDDVLYQTERWFSGQDGVVLGYRVPLPRGRYRVRLHFAEIHHRRPGNRTFDVLLEGQQLLADIDPSRPGLATADSREAELAVTDGLLQIEFSPKKGDPNISGLSIDRID